MTHPLTAPADARSRVESRSEAELLVAEIGGLMDRLMGVLQEETRLIRHAKLMAASRLEPDKAALSSAYARALETLRVNAPTIKRLAPVPVEQLKERHQAFQSELQVNMAVLSTAKSVSESLVRGVADDMASRAKPRTYGAGGLMAVASRAAHQPLSVSRSL